MTYRTCELCLRITEIRGIPWCKHPTHGLRRTRINESCKDWVARDKATQERVEAAERGR